MLQSLKAQLCELHQSLPRQGLVAWTSGNISARDPGTGLVVIKPSGVRYEHLRPEHHVVVDLSGKVIDSDLRPSSDTASHLYIYRHRPDIFGIVHTHSPYATAFAAHGRPIPCCLTAIADEFGGDIPCAGFAMIGGEEIGAQVVTNIGRSPSILLQQHGVFAIGASAEAAVKAAVMTEDAARTVMLAMSLGTPPRLPQADIDRLHNRYTTDYGQR